MQCCLITNGKCLYEINNNCTCMCGDERPYGIPLCEIEKLEHREDIKITKDDLEQFLKEFNQVNKNK